MKKISVLIMYLLNYILRKLNLIYDLFNLSSKGNLFCSLYNIKSFLSNRETWIYFDKHKSIYIAHNQKYKRYFKSKRQSFYAYQKGIFKRGEKIGSEYLLDKICFENGDTVIDCGANIGDLELYFAIKKFNVNYLAFEPSPAEFECLQLNLILDNSRSFNCGLFNKSGFFKFYISSELADSSFIKPNKYTNAKSIETKRFEKIYKDLSLNKIKLFKLEAEGAEPEILFGCESILHNIEYIAADVGFERGTEQKSTLPEVNNYLMKNGFELIDFGRKRIVCLYKNKNFSKD